MAPDPSSALVIVPLSELTVRGLVPTAVVDWLSPFVRQLSAVGFTHLSVVDSGAGTQFGVVLCLPPEVSLEPFGPASFAITTPRQLFVIGATDSNSFEASVTATIALRIPPEILRPLQRTGVDTPGFVELSFTPRVRVRQAGGVTTLSLDAPGGLDLTPAEIGTSGIVISAQGVWPSLLANEPIPEVVDAGFAAGFQGLFIERADVKLPRWLDLPLPATLTFNRCAIGTGGFSGTLDAVWTPVWDATAQTFTGIGSGRLFGRPVGLQSLSLDVRVNQFAASTLTGEVVLPLLNEPSSLGARLSLAGRSIEVTLAHPHALAIPAPSATFQATSLQAGGTIAEDELRIDGQLGNPQISFGALASIAAATANFSLTARGSATTVSAEVTDANFGPLGTIRQAHIQVEDDGSGNRRASLRAQLVWRDISDRITVRPHLPVPRPDSAVTIDAGVVLDASGNQVFRLRLEVASASVNNDALNLIPDRIRPAFRNLNLVITADYASAAQFQSASTSGTLSGSFSAELEARLAPLGFADNRVVTIRSGDRDGWLRATFTASLDAAGNGSLALDVHDPIRFELRLPGLPQSDPFVAAAITRVGFAVGSAASADATVSLEGSFDVRALPNVSAAPLGAHLEHLLARLPLPDLSGGVQGSVRFRGARARLDLEAHFTNAQLELHVFDLLARLAGGQPPAAGDGQPGSIDVDVSFGFRGITFQIGSLEESSSSEVAVAALVADLRVAGVAASFMFRISDQGLTLGMSELPIPLSVPRFPLTRAEVAALHTNAEWAAALDTRRQRIAVLASQPDASTNQELAHLKAQVFLLANMAEIRGRLSRNRATYHAGLETIVGALEQVTGITHVETDLELVVQNVQIAIPFADPRDIRVEGSARLRGFRSGDPFEPLEGVTLTLGLSADRVFFSTTSVGGPVPLPDLGRYPGGHVNVSRFTIGYGFTKNSLSVTLQGDVNLPRQLQEDADTSRTIGFGVRLPQYTSLNFKLDLVPVPGPLPVVPIVEFDLDMRSPAAPGIAGTATCEPFWDGAQLHVPEVFRVGVERFSFSPLFGALPIPNSRFQGDLQIGDDRNGLTVIADNMLYLAGLLVSPQLIPIPFLVDPAYPYFDNFCVNIRFAGFGINFDIQRPFPSLSPLALFEVMGLIADPGMHVEPNGPLANSMRVALRDGRLTLPPVIAEMFPDAERLADKRVEMSVNVGTVITAVQSAIRTAGEMATAIEHGSPRLQRRLSRLVANPPTLSLGTLIGTLPPELRKVRLGGSLAGFEARALLVIADANDIDALATVFENRGRAASPPLVPALALGRTADPVEASLFPFNVPAHPGREYRPADPDSNPFLGREFASFTVDDLRAVPAPRTAQAGVILAAYVRVFEAQRFRLLGALYEDGSFALVTALDVEPLQLRIAGITVRLPLRVSGRLRLSGRARRDRIRGSVEAEATVRNWHAIPAVLRLDIGRRKPVSVRLTSDGHFAFSGDARATLFGGAAVIDGSVDVSHTHCLIDGHLEYAVGPVALTIDGRGRIGPGQRFELAGAGSLTIADVPFTAVKGQLTERGARVEAHLDSDAWRIGGRTLPCSFVMDAAGEIDIARKTRPRFVLEGAATLTVFDATLKGQARLAMTRTGGVRARLAGALLWQGREWLGGRIEMAGSAITIAGRTSLAFNLTPEHFGDIEVASLFFKLDVEGEFTLDGDGGLSAFASVKGDWLLAVQFPNPDSGSTLRRQAFPIAMQSFSVSASATLAKKLLEIRSMRLLPFDITLPGLEVSSTKDLRFHTHGVGIPGIGTLEVLIPRMVGVHTPALDDPFPFPLDSDISKGWKTVATIPTGFKFVNDALTLPASLDFDVFLVWKNGKLDIELRQA